MSEYDEMGDFIVDDPNVATAESGSESEPENDRILQMTSQLKPNQTQQQKLLKAHISVLVSALGGPDHTSTVSPAPYKLGHDALACLKDIKKWIKEVDERKGGYEVAIACADSGLITNDIIHILCQWDSNLSSKIVLTNSKYMEKIMLSLLELLVLLTWPVELTPEMTPNQKLLYPDVKKIQLVYKKHLLGFNNGQTIRAVIRLVLPLISKNKADREPRDHSILRLVLFFLRNVLYIEPANSSLSTKSSKQVISADNLPAGVSYDDISMSAVLVAYKKNKALMLLLTILGLLGADFDRSFAVICLECVYLLVNRVDSAAANDSAKYSTGKSQPPRQSTLDATHSNEQGLSSSSGAVHTSTDPIDISATAPLASITTTAGMHLKDLLDTEAQRKRAQTKTLQTRHGRFGSLILIRANDSTSYVVSGQEALHSTGSTLDKLDKTKKWNDRAHFKYDSDEFVARPQYLNESGRQVFFEFVEQFLTGGCFNNLVESISAHMSSVNDLEVIEEYEKASYFLTISWFFNYKRLKKEDLNFGSVGAALSEINFILIISYLRQSYTSRKWSSLHVALICFNDLLLVSHSLFNKRLDIEDEQHDIDRELAEGIIRKLFSYTDFISLIVQIPQTASKHSPDYLRVCISVVNIILKSFESFANEDIKLYVQTKRKLKLKKKLNNLDPLRDVIEMDLDDEEIEERMQQVKRERRLDFNASEGRFFHSSIVSTHIEYLSRYEDLSFEEIKRCISYFHRLFVVRSDFGGLYRLDFMHTIYKLRNYLPRGTSIRKHVDEFLYYFMKKFKVAFSRFPLPLEILFPRFEDTESRTFLSTGELYIKPESKQGSGPKLAKEVEFVREFTLDEQIKILVSALHEQEKQTLVEWFLEEVFRILKERTMEEGIVCQLNPTPQFKRLLINNSYIRFLMRIIGFDLPYIMDDQILLPSTVALDTLSSCHDLIKKWHSLQPVTFEDGKDASYFLRNREPVFEAQESDIEYNGEYDEDDESIAFVATGDNVTHNAEELDKLEEMERLLENSGRSLGLEKGKAKKKMKEFTKDKTKEARKEKPKRLKKIRSRGPPRTFNVSEDERETPIKSAEFIHDSDDESDSEKANTFFEREERLRQLLSDSGGIINAEQLAEFKKVWSNLERSSGKSASIVAKAVEETSLFVNEEDDDDDDDDVIPAPSVLLSKDIIEDDSDEPSLLNEVEADSIAVNRRHISSPLEAASSQESNSEGADSHIGITQLSEGHTLLRKALSDNSDLDDFSSETISPVAEEASVSKRSRTLRDDSDESEDESFSAPPPAKKKRLIMSDEED